MITTFYTLTWLAYLTQFDAGPIMSDILMHGERTTIKMYSNDSLGTVYRKVVKIEATGLTVVDAFYDDAACNKVITTSIKKQRGG